MICTKTDALESFMKEHLDKSRYEHSLGVERMARTLAGIYGCDEARTGFAGRYHDIAKCFDQETMDEYVRRYGLSESLIGNKSLAHSKVGAAILEHEFGVSDEEVLEMVRWHTTGKAGMNTAEEILYVSDAIEDGRGYAGLKALQKLAREDLDAACIAIMEFAIDDIVSKGKVLDKDTIEARDYIITKINQKDRREND
jgi:predicted HD superfamily hydrolase involved in NAD metabolism